MLGAADHVERVRIARRARLGDGVGQDGGIRVADGGQHAVLPRREVAQVVAAHRAEAREADAKRRAHRAVPPAMAAGFTGVGDLPDCADHGLQLVRGQVRPDRDREDLVDQPVRDWQVKVRGPGHELLQVLLAVDRDRVVDQRPDAALRECLHDPITLTGEAHRVLVPDVLASIWHGRGEVAAEALGEALGIPAALLGPLVEAGQLGEAEGGGEVGGLEVGAERLVVVTDPHPVVPVEAEPVGQGVVVRRGEAALAGHQVLGGVQAEHRRPELACAPAVVRRAVRLGGVLDDRDPVALRDLHQRIHVRHQAVQVDRHDRLGAGRDRRLDSGRDRGRSRRPGRPRIRAVRRSRGSCWPSR